MKQLYEFSDAERILAMAIYQAGDIAEFYKLHDIPDEVVDLLNDEKVLAVLNLRKVQAFERIK